MKICKYIKLVFHTVCDSTGVSCFPPCWTDQMLTGRKLSEGLLWVRVGCSPAWRERHTVTGLWASQLCYISHQEIAKVGVRSLSPVSFSPSLGLEAMKPCHPYSRIFFPQLCTITNAPELCPIDGPKSSQSDNDG